MGIQHYCIFSWSGRLSWFIHIQALSDCHEEKVTGLSEMLEKELYSSTSAGKAGAVSFLLQHVKQSLAFKNFINSGEMITKLNQILVNCLSKKNTVGIISAL